MFPLERLYPILVSLQSFDLGLGIGWSMPAASYLSQDHPRRIVGGNDIEIVNGFSKTELAWMFSSFTLVTIIACLIYPILMRKTSPRSHIKIVGFFKVVLWSILLFGDVKVLWYVFARAFFGLAFPVIGLVILYIEEITEAYNRGFFLSFCDLSLNAGVLTAFVLGSSLEFHINLIILFSLSLVFWAICFLLPESPIWLKNHDLTETAFINLKRLRPKNYDLTSEMNDIDKYLSKSVKLETTLLKNLSLILSNRHFSKSIILLISLFLLQQLSGISVMMYYAVELVDENGPVDEFSMVVMEGVGCFSGSLIAACLSDRIGRRPLLLVSTSGSFISLGIISLYSYLGLNFPWIPIVGVFTYVFMTNIGLGPIPYVLMAELFPYHLRIWGTYASLIFCGTFSFITSISYNYLSEHLGKAGAFGIYCSFNLITFVVILQFIPETMAIPRHLIENKIFLKVDDKDLEDQEANLKLDN